MLTSGATHCLRANGNPAQGDDGVGATYYDSIKVYGDIMAYTGDVAKWKPCQDASVAAYRERYLFPNNGALPGYWNFSGGLRRHFETTGDARSKQAVLLLAANAAFCSDGTNLWDSPDLAREVGYCIEARLDAEALGASRTPYYARLIASGKAQLDQWFISKTYHICMTCDFSGPSAARGRYYIQPFMVGIITRALLRDYALSNDATILPLVKVALDYLWARTWNARSEAFFYENWADAADSPWQASTAGAPDLNLLLANVYYNYSKASGDPSYRVKSDAIFAGGAKGAFLAQPKQFNQSYQWSIDMVKDRTQ